MVDQHPSIETMVRTVVDGFQISLLALVKLLIVIGWKGINLPLLSVGFMCAEEFLQKFSLHLCPIYDSP